MALETVVFQQDPFSYGSFKELSGMGGEVEEMMMHGSNNCVIGNGSSGFEEYTPTTVRRIGRRKRRRTTETVKKMEEMGSRHRMTHIAIERNRRRQMNDYLAVLHSLMPLSYAQRGDQGSIVGGAINFVKVLEQLLQLLQGQKQWREQQSINANKSNSTSCNNLFSYFFTFPQYSTSATPNTYPMAAAANDVMAAKPSTVADIEVTVVEGHANIKVLSRRFPRQLLKMVTRFHSMGFTILHLNLTTFDQKAFYSSIVKIEEECQHKTASEIATFVHEMMAKIQEEAVSS